MWRLSACTMRWSRNTLGFPSREPLPFVLRLYSPFQPSRTAACDDPGWLLPAQERKFRASDYLVIAAYQIAAHTPYDQYATAIERTEAFYEGMRAKHRFLTGRDDYIFAAMLVLFILISMAQNS